MEKTNDRNTMKGMLVASFYLSLPVSKTISEAKRLPAW